MTISKPVALVVIALAAAWAMEPLLGCGNCDDIAFHPVESGNYVIVPPDSDHVYPGDEWLSEAVSGNEIHIDRDAEVATIRYTRTGTTYEVRYTLVSR